jgi:hypothetical protein
MFAVSGCGVTDGGDPTEPNGASARIVPPGETAGTGCDARGARPSRRPTPILGIHHAPSLTRERYEAVVHGLTNGPDRLQSVSDGSIEELLVHAAGEGDDGFWVIDIWASQEPVDRFAQRVRPIAQAAGIEEPLRTYKIHTSLTC